jgi:chromosome segregation ATPase
MKKTMDNHDEPVTRGEFNEAMQMIANAFEKVATKDDLVGFQGELTDVQETQTSMQGDINQLKQTQAVMQEDTEQLKQTQETILSVVQTTAEQVKDLNDNMKDIPRRVTELENDMIKVKSHLF